jgi:hypothetical protein
MMEGEMYFSIEGNFPVKILVMADQNGKYVFSGKVIKSLQKEERNYIDAKNEEEAIEMARKQGIVGSGMVFCNLGISHECVLGLEGLAN